MKNLKKRNIGKARRLGKKSRAEQKSFERKTDGRKLMKIDEAIDNTVRLMKNRGRGK
jgi:hypothetical protein